jgi:hypothetical protein
MAQPPFQFIGNSTGDLGQLEAERMPQIMGPERRDLDGILLRRAVPSTIPATFYALDGPGVRKVHCNGCAKEAYRTLSIVSLIMARSGDRFCSLGGRCRRYRLGIISIRRFPSPAAGSLPWVIQTTRERLTI